VKGLIIPVLVLAGTFWIGLPDPYPTSFPPATSPTVPSTAADAESPSIPPGNLKWLESLLGKLQRASLPEMISLPVDGLDLLADASPANSAAMAELRRWQEKGPWAVENIQIQVGSPDEERAIHLTAKFQGVSSSVVPILEHLLASPYRQGYLIDPSHLRMAQDDAGILRVVFRVRVLAAPLFLTGGSQ